MEGGENKTDWETDPKSGKLRKKKSFNAIMSNL